MAEHSTIEWTDATWSPITGCSVVSPGCTNCYAMKLAGTRLAHHPSRAGLTRETKAGPVWTGEVRLNEDWLTLPLRWKRPRDIFVCAHGDLFHAGVPFETIAGIFGVMSAARRHRFQVLTKRSARMREFFAWLALQTEHKRRWVEQVNQAERMCGEPLGSRWSESDAAEAVAVYHFAKRLGADLCGMYVQWPLPNVWLGVSAEDQTRADERVPDLLATPAAVRFVSAEPLLGPIDFHDYFVRAQNGFSERLGWIIVGGESGSGARPMHPQWARDIRDQCADAGVSFFFKQWGEWVGGEHVGHAVTVQTRATCSVSDVHQFDRHFFAARVGKARAGRLLDGREHNEMPEARHG